MGQLSRRNLLQGAVVLSGFALSAPASQHPVPSAATPSPTAQSISDRLDFAIATFFTPTWTQQVTAAFPVHYTLGRRHGKSTLKVDWDARFFAVNDVVSGVVRDGIRELTARRDGDQALTIDIPIDVSEVVFRVEVTDNYPNENLADAHPTGLSLIDRSGRVLEKWRDVPEGTDCSPWSIEAAVNWISHDSLIVPARIAMASIGPSAAPAGTVLRATYADVLGEPVLVDPTTPEALDPGSIGTGDGSARRALPGLVERSVVDGICELTLTTTTSLTAGSSLELLFEVAVGSSRVDLQACKLEYSIVSPK